MGLYSSIMKQQGKRKYSDRELFVRYTKRIAPYKKNIFIIAIFIFISTIAEIVSPLLVGFGVGKLSKIIIVKILHTIGFKKVTQKSGTDKALAKTGYRYDTANLIGDLVKWIFYLIFAGGAVQVLFGEQLLTDILLVVATYIPRIIGVIIVIMAGFVFGDIGRPPGRTRIHKNRQRRSGHGSSNVRRSSQAGSRKREKRAESQEACFYPVCETL